MKTLEIITEFIVPFCLGSIITSILYRIHMKSIIDKYVNSKRPELFADNIEKACEIINETRNEFAKQNLTRKVIEYRNRGISYLDALFIIEYFQDKYYVKHETEQNGTRKLIISKEPI